LHFLWLNRKNTTLKVLDQTIYENIHRAEVATVKAPLTLTTEVPQPTGKLSETSTSVQEMPIDKLIFVKGDRKEAVEFQFSAGTAGKISRQINILTQDAKASKFSIEIGHPERLPMVIGWVSVVLGILVMLAKPTVAIEQ
jgi:hypothetical protein